MKKIQTFFVGLLLTGFAYGQSASNKTKPTMLTNKQKIEALYASFETGDPTAAQLYLKLDYIQHNLNIGNGIAGFGEVMKSRPPQGFKAKIVRLLEDGNFVITHSEYDFFGPKVGFGIFRFENGQVAEHWDNLEPIQPKNPSGRTQLDGETKVTDKNKTNANKTIVKKFVDDVLVGGKMEKAPDYLSPDYRQHSSSIADGINGLAAAFKYFKDQGLTLQITKTHKILGEGNFVLTVSEGRLGRGQGELAAFYDLFRLENGKLVEHWDVVEMIPAKETWKNLNGKF